MLDFDDASFRPNPYLFFFLIDASRSMEPYQTDVVEGHNLMLSMLRDSSQCQDGNVFVSQRLFADALTVLSPLTPLSHAGEDQVARLSTTNYVPHGQSALHDAIVACLTDLEGCEEYIREQGICPRIKIVLITDGEDNESKAKDKDVRGAIERFHEGWWSAGSILIATGDAASTVEMLEEARLSIGFKHAVSLDRKSLRRAFQSDHY